MSTQSIAVQMDPCKSLITNEIYSLPPLATWVSYQPFALSLLQRGEWPASRIRTCAARSVKKQNFRVCQRTGSGRALKKLATCSITYPAGMIMPEEKPGASCFANHLARAVRGD